MMHTSIALMLKHKQQHTDCEYFINGIDFAILNVYTQNV